MASPPSNFREMVVRRRDACVKFKDDKPSKDRREALRFYRGDNLPAYGDSGDGLSTVVSRDTMEAIESVMPPLVRPFVAGEEVVSFEPIEKNDTEAAQQATDYVNHVFRRHNSVLDVAQTGLKDGLLFRLGVAKTVMEECEEGSPETFADMGEEELSALLTEGREVAGPIVQDELTQLFTVTVAPKKVKKYRVHIIAPDEFLYEERLANLKQATFLGHSKQLTLADVIDMGIDAKKAQDLKSGRPTSEEADERHGHEDEGDWSDDDPARPLWVDECYIKCDPDKKGVLEWRKVVLGGSQSTVLSNEVVDGHPYSTWTPVPIPHKLVGMSMADLTRDIQVQRTAIKREAMNALYLANRPMQEYVDGQVNLDDFLNPSVGGKVRVKQLGMIREIPSGDARVIGTSLSMDEALQSEREARTGVTRYNQGMDSGALNKTATGMNIIASNSQQRQELVARQFGEFLSDIFDKLLKLVSQHADPADVERLRGKQFVPWPTDYDTNVSVGLGTNNKDQLVGHIMAISQVYEKIITLQQGMQGPLVTEANVYELLKRLPEAMGLKGDFFTDPAQAQLQAPQQEEPPQDPLAGERMKQDTELQKEQMRQQTELQKEQMRQQPVVVPISAGMGL
jgi:hypothetical protein